MLKKAKDVQADVAASAHKVWLAGLGALAVAQEEGGKLFDTLVKKGEDVEARGMETLKTARGQAASAWQRVGKGLDDQVTAALHRLGVPTREEIATLSRRVEALTASIEKLKAETTGAAGSTDRGTSRTEV